MGTGADILGVSVPMFTSVVTGVVLLMLSLALFWLAIARRGDWGKRHQLLAWILAAGIALHGAWGVFAIFVLKA